MIDINKLNELENKGLSAFDLFIANVLLSIEAYEQETGERLTLEKWLEITKK